MAGLDRYASGPVRPWGREGAGLWDGGPSEPSGVMARLAGAARDCVFLRRVLSVRLQSPSPGPFPTLAGEPTTSRVRRL